MNTKWIVFGHSSVARGFSWSEHSKEECFCWGTQTDVPSLIAKRECFLDQRVGRDEPSPAQSSWLLGSLGDRDGARNLEVCKLALSFLPCSTASPSFLTLPGLHLSFSGNRLSLSFPSSDHSPLAFKLVWLSSSETHSDGYFLSNFRVLILSQLSHPMQCQQSADWQWARSGGWCPLICHRS